MQGVPEGEAGDRAVPTTENKQWITTRALAAILHLSPRQARRILDKVRPSLLVRQDGRGGDITVLWPDIGDILRGHGVIVSAPSDLESEDMGTSASAPGRPHVPNNPAHHPPHNSAEYDRELDFLRAQLVEKDKQLLVKDQQIAAKDGQIAAHQQSEAELRILLANRDRQIDAAMNRLLESKPDAVEETPPAPEPPKRRRWPWSKG